MGILEIVLPVAVSFVITVIAGKLLIPALVRLKAGQSIKEIGPTWHMTKQGTPTMGGLMFIIGIGITIVALGWKHMAGGDFAHLYVYLFALVFGLIGYIDDYQKVKHHHNTGLTALQKFVLQLAAAVAFLCLMRYEGMLSPNLYIPFWNTHVVLPWSVYLVFAAFVIVGTVNAVNITDGLDGLSTSVTIPVAAFFSVMAIIWPGFAQLGTFSAAMLGGLCGFLVYNRYPAKVFMGDTGSLFLGGAVAALAFAYDMPLVLILVLALKKPWGIAIVSTATAYLCCQPPRWGSMAVEALTHSAVAGNLVYIVLLSGSFYLFRRYFVAAAYGAMTSSPTALLRETRLKTARALLRGTTMHISEIAWSVGYPDALYFSRVFAASEGCSPSVYRAGQEHT